MLNVIASVDGNSTGKLIEPSVEPGIIFSNLQHGRRSLVSAQAATLQHVGVRRIQQHFNIRTCSITA